MKDQFRRWYDPTIVWRAAPVALIVGSLLNLINHYDLLLGRPLIADNLIQIALTYVVPYCVSTHGQVCWRKDSAARDNAWDRTRILEAGPPNPNLSVTNENLRILSKAKVGRE